MTENALRKVLLMKRRAMGDTVLLLSSIAAIKKRWPDCSLHVCVPKQWRSLIEAEPSVDQTWSYPRGFRMTLETVTRMRREKFEAVFHPHASPSSARLARLTGAPLRAIHFHGIDEKNYHSTVRIQGKGEIKPAIERDLDTIRSVAESIESPAPAFHFADEEKESARAWLDEQGLDGEILSLGLGASRPSKAWPLEHYVDLAKRWIARGADHQVLILIGPHESELAHQVRSKLNSEHVRIASGLTPRQSAAVLSRVRVHVGNDSGPKHLAIAAGTQTLTFFGPVDPFEWHPYDQELHPYLFISGLPCRQDAPPGYPAWCGIEVCTKEQHRCMKEIHPDAAWAKIETLLKRN
jgi:ADP-heptose:LPS heptosyltransferase